MDRRAGQPHEMEGEVYFPAPEIVGQGEDAHGDLSMLGMRQELEPEA